MFGLTEIDISLNLERKHNRFFLFITQYLIFLSSYLKDLLKGAPN